MTLTTPFRGRFVNRNLRLDIIYLFAKFNDSSFSRSRDIIGAAKLKMGHGTWTTPLLKVICHRFLWLDVAYLCTKFDHSSFSRSRDIVGALQNLNGSRDLATPFSGMICHPWANTYYGQPIYLFWTLYLNPLQRYERWYKMSKLGSFGG